MLDKGRVLPLRCLVKEIKPPEKKGSIIIPVDDTKNPTISGEVRVVGDLIGNFKDFKLDIGDKVLFGPNSFIRVMIEDEEYLLLNIQDILFIWR